MDKPSEEDVKSSTATWTPANVSNLELGDLPSVSEAASLTRHGSKGENGSKYSCPDCVEEPESFQLPRKLAPAPSETQARPHGACVKQFVCRDPTEAGLVSKLSVILPLSECRSCARGKKYNIEYNAAEHLRSDHFQKKSTRNRNRNRDSVKEPGDEERGGRGGGNQGPMICLNDLRPWIREVTVYRGEDCETSNAE
ncbi:hypothetical protein E4U17_002698 [Claviceps sp. LM77 group G4]|nr:hypothetical protein E4U17_002698 [Claviceps sp. LM77 group G4]KAG6076118.1 hypothetical protein E4U16_002978 [Claviceps sp. LM84 group G4]KAG6086825.1 hypothetical protein E4U33_000068 [Claviceps sp. LM78 group G4]